MGTNFSRVRIHDDPPARRLADHYDAAALTLGSDVYFDARVRPHEPDGRWLLAHELAHVRDGGSGQIDMSRASQPDDAVERHADKVAANVLANRAVPAARPHAGPRIVLRQPKPPARPAPIVTEVELSLAGGVIVAQRQGAPPVAASIVGASHLDSLLGERASYHITWLEQSGCLIVPDLPMTMVFGGPEAPSFDESDVVGPGDPFRLFRIADHPEIGGGIRSARRPVPLRIFGRAARPDSAKGGSRSSDTPVEQPAPTTKDTEATSTKTGGPTGKQTSEAAAPKDRPVHPATSAPLERNDDVMASRPELARFYLSCLERIAGLKVDLARAAKGLDRKAIEELVKGNADARSVTDYVTQGWTEFFGGGGTDFVEYEVLEETILTQWSRGNDNVRRNALYLGNDADGDGIFIRDSGIKYYDRYGQPLMGVLGVPHDAFYRAFGTGSLPKIAVDDPGLPLLMAAYRHVQVDDPFQVYVAAKGYMDNRDLVRENLWEGWAAGDDVARKLGEQKWPLVGFLSVHSVALLCKTNSRTKLIGWTLDTLLTAAGYWFNLYFAGSSFDKLIGVGSELAQIRRKPGEPLDHLSEEHLGRAIVRLRGLLSDLVAAGLTAAVLSAAKTASQTIGTPRPPLPELAVAGGGRTSGAAAVGGPPGEFPRGLPIALQMSRKDSDPTNKAAATRTPGPPAPQRQAGFELSDSSLPLEQRIAFLRRNRSQLGPKQGRWFDDLEAGLEGMDGEQRAEAERRIKPWEETVDAKLRTDYAARLSHLLGLNVIAVSRIPSRGLGGEMERINRLIDLGERAEVSFTIRENGITVQVDAVARRGKVLLIEYKAGDLLPPEINAQSRAERIRKLYLQMERQAEVAEAKDLDYFEWRVEPDQVHVLVDIIYGKLRQARPNLADKIRITEATPSR